MDECKKDFHTQKFCYILNGKTFFNHQNAKQYLIDNGRAENFADEYLSLLRKEYLESE